MRWRQPFRGDAHRAARAVRQLLHLERSAGVEHLRRAAGGARSGVTAPRQRLQRSLRRLPCAMRHAPRPRASAVSARTAPRESRWRAAAPRALRRKRPPWLCARSSCRTRQLAAQPPSRSQHAYPRAPPCATAKGERAVAFGAGTVARGALATAAPSTAAARCVSAAPQCSRRCCASRGRCAARATPRFARCAAPSPPRAPPLPTTTASRGATRRPACAAPRPRTAQPRPTRARWRAWCSAASLQRRPKRLLRWATATGATRTTPRGP